MVEAERLEGYVLGLNDGGKWKIKVTTPGEHCGKNYLVKNIHGNKDITLCTGLEVNFILGNRMNRQNVKKIWIFDVKIS